MGSVAEFYGDLIDLCGISVVNSGRLAVKVQGGEDETTEIPLTYDGFPIIFPERQYMNAPENKEEKAILLHPLVESSLRAPSVIQDILRKAAIVRLCNTGGEILARAVHINYEASMSGIALNHQLSKLFAPIGESIDQKFNGFFLKLIDAMAKDSSHRLFNIYLKQHGEIGKSKFNRLCVISSPLYDEIMVGVEGNKLWGVTAPRKKDLETLRILLETLFPDLAGNGYITGSSANVAPTLMAFMDGVATVSKRFSKLLSIYGKEAKGIIGGTCKGQDYEKDQDFSQMRNSLPMDEYNVGVGKDEPKRDEDRSTPSRSVVAETLAVPKREEPKRESKSEEPITIANERRPSRDDQPQRHFWDVDDRYDDRDDYRRNDRYREDFRDRFSRSRQEASRSDYRRDDYRRDDYRRDDYRRDDYRRDSGRRSDRYNDRYESDNRDNGGRYFWE